ncbi:MAG: signal peptidase I [Planctomycetes bacterium]|nr:signal peptidase I [Planctomycetota bacterium]
MRRALRTLIVGLVLIAVHRHAFHFSIVRGSSMNPTFVDDERIVVERLSLLLGEEPRRGEIVVFSCPTDPELDFVKRVIGLPGDEVRLERGQLYVNGERASEDYALTDLSDRRTWRVPSEHVFVLGDNRPRSCDSRSFDCVPLASLRGRVCARVWPWERVDSF